MIEDKTYTQFDDAAKALVARGFLNTNAGWLNGRGKLATVVDLKDVHRGIPRSFGIVIEDCDRNGRPIVKDDE